MKHLLLTFALLMTAPMPSYAEDLAVVQARVDAREAALKSIEGLVSRATDTRVEDRQAVVDLYKEIEETHPVLAAELPAIPTTRDDYRVFFKAILTYRQKMARAQVTDLRLLIGG